jgi:hypothetical protein
VSRSIGRTPPLRLVANNEGVQLRLLPDEAVEQALPLARQLQLMADVVGPASRDVADELVAILEGPRRPRRVA